jgi:hypothetical protein
VLDDDLGVGEVKVKAVVHKACRVCTGDGQTGGRGGTGHRRRRRAGAAQGTGDRGQAQTSAAAAVRISQGSVLVILGPCELRQASSCKARPTTAASRNTACCRRRQARCLLRVPGW